MQPNIVLIMSDQHRADVMGCAGDPAVITPNMDALAKSGVRFSSTNCQGPLCMPARTSFATERWVRDHGVFDNFSEVPAGTPTFLHGLREAGYHTAEIGKMHFWMHSRHPGKTSWDFEPFLESLGFGESLETLGKHASLRRDNPYSAHLRHRGLLDDYQRVLEAKQYRTDDSQPIPSWDVTPCAMPIDDYVDGWHGVQAERWIEAYDRDEPFFLWLGFPGPHDPWDAPLEVRHWYDEIDIPAPASSAPPDPTHTDNLTGLLELMQGIGDSATLTPDRIAEVRTAYYAAVTIIDQAIGRVVGALERTGRLDNTWVIYTSDHGEMLGDHQLLFKCVFYDASVRVPLIVRPPSGTEGQTVDALVEHIDVAATIRDIAGAPAPPSSEARSFLGYFAGDDPEPREVSITENWGFAAFETAEYKLVVDEDTLTPLQLFDRGEDPNEDTNVVVDPAYRDAIESIMSAHVRPFLATAPVRPHRSMFAAESLGQ
ncbi:MAG: sulfatase-like hydrolase/transferase [Acidimicrobiia bacterium]|nr:sulfatase-like hydrolase/transferase [Acidimicrobiia bacterium]